MHIQLAIWMLWAIDEVDISPSFQIFKVLVNNFRSTLVNLQISLIIVMHVFIKLCRLKKKEEGGTEFTKRQKLLIAIFWVLTWIYGFNCVEHVDYTSGKKIDIFTMVEFFRILSRLTVFLWIFEKGRRIGVLVLVSIFQFFKD